MLGVIMIDMGFIEDFFNNEIGFRSKEEISEFLFPHIMSITPRQRMEFLYTTFIQNKNGNRIGVIPRRIAADIIAEYWNCSDIGKTNAELKLEILELLNEASVKQEPTYILKYCRLPDEVIIYRGIRGHKNSKGIYWTLDKAIAEFFALKYARPGYPLPDSKTKAWIYTGRIKKDKIVYMTNDKDEKEIVCKPGEVKIIKCEAVKLKSGFGSDILYIE